MHKRMNHLFNMPKGRSRLSSAFTIVELLVTIVIIGVLATITVVSYNGITNRANIAFLQSSLNNASTLLEIYFTTNGNFPASLAY